MKCEILDFVQKDIWSDYLNKLLIVQQDIFFTPEYYGFCEKNGDGKAKCFVFEDNKEVALYPFLMNSVNSLGYKLDSEYFDIQGAYGYNGVGATTYDNEFRKLFFQAFNEYCQENNIIAEFTRFNPITKNHVFSDNHLKIINVNQNIISNLSINDIWTQSYERSTRKNINKAIRSGLEVNCFPGSEVTLNSLHQFYDIYIDTMARNSAEKKFYFDATYFENIAKKIDKNSLFFFTLKDDKPISCELVLTSKKIGYSFLGGTLSEYYEYRPNDILKHEIVNVLKQKKIDFFCLGGGPVRNDGIFNYKRKFAKNGTYDFWIGRKIHNQYIYSEVIKQWELNSPEKVEGHKNILLKYRN